MADPIAYAGAVSDECPVAGWHGTKVASVISGSEGLDGVSPGSPLVSLRVLGLCDTVCYRLVIAAP